MGNENIVDRYYELLNKAKSLVELTDDENVELQNYEIRLLYKKRWNNRESYIKLVKSFLNGSTTGDDFTGLFCKIRSDDIEKEIEINENSFTTIPVMKLFSYFINEIYLTSDRFDDEAGPNEEYGEAWLKDVVSDSWNDFLEESRFEEFH